MKKIWVSDFRVLSLLICAVFAGSAVSATSSGMATLVSDGRTYQGTYSTADKLISFDIDGLVYKGYYASHAEDSGSAISGISAGKWGRAFLFASSAKVLRCQLEAGFPMAKGQCQGTDGRIFRLTSDVQKNASVVPKRPVAK